MREIQIDEDTVIGFDYENHYYFIENKETTTTRTTPENALAVLKIVAPDTTLTTDDLVTLATQEEHITELSYTWEDTGAYIKTIQLNDYKKYPLTLDAEKDKLYIMNSTIIFDLNLNEGRRVRLEQIQAFYRDTLGLYVPLQDLQTLYTILISFYLPACYNEITVLEDTTDGTEGYALKYNDTLKLSDYHETAPITYTCALNPNNDYNYTVIAEVTSIDGNAITLNSTVPTVVQEGTLININDTTVQVDTTTYSADGMYTVKAIETNTIYTTENLSSNFSITPTYISTLTYKNFISSISRDNNTITLTNSANNFLVGDTIVVNNATIGTGYETLSLNGFYTITDITGNTLTVDETLITNYSTANTAYVYKPLPQLTVLDIEGDRITVAEDTIPSTIQSNTPIAVISTVNGIKTAQYTTVVTLYQGDHQIKVSDNLDKNIPRYGQLRQPIANPNVLITVSNTTDEEHMPTGTFMVDTTEQAVEYLGLISSVPLPSTEAVSENENNIGNFNMCNNFVKNYYIINSVGGITRMKLIGIYTKIYEEN